MCLTGNEGDLADEDPLCSEEELNHYELPVLLLQVDRHVAGVLDRQVRHVAELHRSVVPEFILLKRDLPQGSAMRWNIESTHPMILFTHFKTNTKSIDIYRVLRCCVLMKKSKHSESHEMG